MTAASATRTIVERAIFSKNTNKQNLTYFSAKFVFEHEQIFRGHSKNCLTFSFREQSLGPARFGLFSRLVAVRLQPATCSLLDIPYRITPSRLNARLARFAQYVNSLLFLVLPSRCALSPSYRFLSSHAPIVAVLRIARTNFAVRVRLFSSVARRVL